MIDARTGQPEPCPMCGSVEVRWRRRRWYDRVRNQIRFWTESLLSGVFGRPSVEYPRHRLQPRRDRQDLSLLLGEEHEFAAVQAELTYETSRELYETRIAATTPDRFWKCGACGKRGHVFDNAAALLAPRARLAQLEDSMKPTWDSQVHNPVDRTGMRGHGDD